MLPMLRALVLALTVPAQPAGAQDYRLAEGDAIEFDVLDDAEPVRRLTIAQDGQVQLPLLGTVAIAGLTAPEAQERIRAAYVDRDLLRDPKIAFAVAAFRPVFVLGDVRDPGRVDYQPLMTVEQAVGLAGGTASVTASGEERLLTEAGLRGELRVAAAEMAREAARLARLQAEADGTDALTRDAVPEEAHPFVDWERFEGLLDVEREILATDRAALADGEAALTAEREAREREVALLSAREANARDQIASREADRDRLARLAERGTVPVTQAAEAERALAEAQDAALEVTRRRTEAERELLELGAEIDRLRHDRRREALLAVQDARLEMQRLLARRGSIEERIALVASWQSERARDDLAIETTYRVRRRDGEAVVTEPRALTDRVLPGDVVLVAIELPG